MKSIVATSGSFTLILAAVAALAIPAPVIAQETGLEEIVVTARYREEKLQETPIAITAISAEDIEVRAFTNSYELGYTVPNASFRPAQAAYGNTMTAYIRGVGQNDFDQAFEPGVGIYVDDVYQPFTLGSQMDLLDLERVEVLRGPQGTLFGRGSIGGVVRMVSKRPEGDNTGFINVTTGSYQRVDIRAGYDFAVTDNLFSRITGVSKDRDGHQEVIDFACENPALAGALPVRDPSRGRKCEMGTQGGDNIKGARGQLRWVVSDAFEINAAIDYQHDNSEAEADTLVDIIYPTDLQGNIIPTQSYTLWNTEYAQHVPNPAVAFEDYGYGIPYDDRFIPDDIYKTYATYDDPQSGLTFDPKSSLERASASLKADWEISDTMAATVILAYTDMTGQLTTDADASPMNLQVTGGEQQFSWGTAEIRFSGRAWDRMDWTVGGFFYDGKASNFQAVSFPPILWGVFRNILGLPPFVAASIAHGPNNVAVNTRNIADPKNQSGFGHAVFDITDQMHFTAGVRYSHDKKDVDFDNSFFVGPIEIDDNHFDWRVGLDYSFTEDIMAYGSIATGYRPPAYNPRPFTAAQAVAVGGEEMTAFEGGIKADLFDRKVRANIAGFYSDYNKRIVPIGGTECIPPFVPAATPGAIQDSAGNICLATTSLTNYEQLKDGEVSGVELEVEWRPIDQLTINGIFGWTHWSSPEVDDCDFNQDGVPDAGLTCTDTPNFVPELNWAVSASYEFPMGNGSMLTPRVDLYGQSEICSSVVSSVSCVDSYELLNLRLEWTSPERVWTAAIGGTNVTDKEYFYNIFDLTLFGQNTVEGQPARPAEWYFTLSRNF
jgi:iron complex outermembrane receptor protein